MKAITKFLAGGVAMAALASAAPAAAQYFPGYGSPYGYGMPGYGGYSPYGYGVNSQVIVNQCANAVQARLSGGYGSYGAYGGGYGGYNGYNSYGYAGGGARVLGISRVEQGLAGAINVRGVATSGRYGGYAANAPVDLVWKCKADQRGAIINIDVNAAQPAYGGYNNYTPWNYDYSQYGYTRY